MIVEFKGKQIDCTEICEGVAKKTDSVFYIYDHASGEWKYCAKNRLEDLEKKYGSLEEVGKSYRSRKSTKSPSGAKGDNVARKSVSKTIDEPVKQESKAYLWIHPAMRGPEYDGEDRFDAWYEDDVEHDPYHQREYF